MKKEAIYSDAELEQIKKDQLDALTFRRLLKHLDDNKGVQNIDLMTLAGFCRNCLSKWYLAEAGRLNITMTDDEARERVYGMPYSEWKSRYQLPATEEQMLAYKTKKAAK